MSTATSASSTVATYVTAVYRDLFDRSPDATGLATWTSRLTSGTPRIAVANSITSSAEYRSTLITGAYSEYLGRTPDRSGLSSWLAGMGAGMTIQQLESGFTSSDEYYKRAGSTDAKWVSTLYADVLGRSASAAEIRSWVSRIGSGMTRESVAMGFLLSSERLKTVINGSYKDLLHRSIDAQGTATWVAAIQKGTRTEDVIGGIIASDEYVAANGGAWAVSAPSTTASTPSSTTGYPSASSTGVPAGVTLTPYTGPSRITQPGTVIDAKLITTPLVITASAHNVTIKNSKISAQGFWLVLNDEGATNLQIIDTEMDGKGNTSSDAAIAGRNYTLTRVNIHGTVDGLKLGSNVTVQDSYIHDLVMTADSHNDGMQSLGSNDVLIQHNTVIMPSGATSAILLSTGSADSMRRITINNNLVAGGAYTIYGGYQAGVDVLSRVSDIKVTNNRISTSVHPNGGAYGPLTSVSSPAVSVSGNVWHDGPKAGQAL
ncbi:DUF4214 domain-containing protein [Actinotalea sp.]|uniref:DUF4214 domain-containing protein n=1 Tax=Actinotalea sp. TaxID=1872145 RepID=UPI00356200DE